MTTQAEKYVEVEQCDQCPAKAVTWALGPPSDKWQELRFCMHHTRANEEALKAKGWQIQFPF